MGSEGWRKTAIIALTIATCCCALLSQAGADESSALAAFLAAVGPPDITRVNWPINGGIGNGGGSTPCTWQGIECNAAGNVITLRLPGVGLSGTIPAGIFSQLQELRVLSLHSNKLSGELPPDLSQNCAQLRAVYLHNNSLTGPLPTLEASRLPLTHLDFSFNSFSSTIPTNYADFHRLQTLYLQHNALSGELPATAATAFENLAQLDLSYNAFSGTLPPPLQSKFGGDAFQGNSFCGQPLFSSCGSTGAPSPSFSIAAASAGNAKHKLSVADIAAISVGAVAVVAFILACCLVCCSKRRRKAAEIEAMQEIDRTGAAKSDNDNVRRAENAAESGDKDVEVEIEEGSNQLIFVGDEPQHVFDLEELLRSSAEVLGKGGIGTSYKAALADESGRVVVVKRLKDVNLGKTHFQNHMALLAGLSKASGHLLPLRAYYYSKEEKLLIHDYLPLGSLGFRLHGSTTLGKTPLDWETRLRIAYGIAKGINFIHEQGGNNKFVHGNIKASNVLLSENCDAILSDYLLAPLFGSNHVFSKVVGYRALEVMETKKLTQKSDVYSFGVLLMELLTGKAPAHLSNEKGIDLPRWVQSVVREEWTSEVFDLDLMRYQNIEEEMVQTLQVAMSCVATSPDERPSMAQVLKMIEDVRTFET